MTILPMLLAATGIGIGHAILPDHWMPLALLARTRNYPPRRTARLALAAAVTHVVVSVLLGTALAAVGLRFRETVARHAGLAVGGVLVATAVALAVLEVAGRGHQHAHSCADEHDHADAPAAATRHLPAQAARRSGRSTAVLERPIATAEPESDRSSAPLSGSAAQSASRRSLLPLPGRAARSVPDSPRGISPLPSGSAAQSASRRSLLPLPGRAPRSVPDSPRGISPLLSSSAAQSASRRSLLPLPRRAPRSAPDSPRRILSLLPGPAAHSGPRRSLLPLSGRTGRSVPDSSRRSLPLLPGRSSRSVAHAPRRDLPLLPGPAAHSEPHTSRSSLVLSPGAAVSFVADPHRRRTLPTLPRTSADFHPEVPRYPAAPASPAPEPPRRNLLTLLAPFGAAASPDLTILPLFLTAGALGVGPALGVLAAFALATVAVMVGLTLAAAGGARRLTAPWIEERATLLTAATLLVIGVLVVGGVL